MTVSIVAGREVVAALDQADELVDHRRRAVDVGVVAVEREHVAAQKQLAAEPVLELAQDGVLGARELGGDRVVEGELAARHYAAEPARDHRADPLAVGAAADLRHQRRPSPCPCRPAPRRRTPRSPRRPARRGRRRTSRRAGSARSRAPRPPRPRRARRCRRRGRPPPPPAAACARAAGPRPRRRRRPWRPSAARRRPGAARRRARARRPSSPSRVSLWTCSRIVSAIADKGTRVPRAAQRSTRSTSPSGSCRKRVPSSRKLSGSPVQTNR